MIILQYNYCKNGVIVLHLCTQTTYKDMENNPEKKYPRFQVYDADGEILELIEEAANLMEEVWNVPELKRNAVIKTALKNLVEKLKAEAIAAEEE